MTSSAPTRQAVRAPGPARWPLHLAAAAALASLLEEQPVALAQMGLLAGAAALSRETAGGASVRRRGPLGYLYYLLTLPVFLGLVNPLRTEEELPLIRVVYYVLLATVYLLPWLRFSSASDLRRVTVVLTAVFFISATYFYSQVFLPALVLAAFGLTLAFHSLERPPSLSLARLAGGQVLAAVAVGALLFFAFPRAWFRTAAAAAKYRGRDMVGQSLSASQQAAEAGMPTRRDMLQLPRLLDFSRSGAEVLRLRLTAFPSGAPYVASDSMYLRAAVFDSFVNGSWIARPHLLMYWDREDGKRDGWIWLRNAFARTNSLRLRQRIQMVPMDDLCFALPDAVAIQLSKVRYDARGVFALPSRITQPLEYEAISELPVGLHHPSLTTPARPAYPASLANCLVVPDYLRPLLNELIASWRLSGRPVDRLRQMQERLRQEFSYGPVAFAAEPNRDPLEIFLTDSRSGYCSHFASAFALLARSIGLPARVASGFHFTGPPSADGYYHVLELNAHAWTEVFFPDFGWVVCDATPETSRPVSDRRVASRSFREVAASLLHLNDQFSEFDAADQRIAVASARRVLRVAAASWRAVLSAPWFWTAAALCATGLWMIFRRLPVRRRRWLAQRLVGRSPTSSVPFYEDFLWLLARHGLAKPAAATGWEHALAIRNRADLPEIEQLTRLFYRVKYSGYRPSHEELREADRWLARLETALSSHVRHNGRQAA